MPLPDLNSLSDIDKFVDKLPIKENPLASMLGIKSTNDNLLQFYNRFGENNILQDRPLSTVIAKPYYFNVVWTFTKLSKVEKLLRASMKESTTEALKYFIQSVELPDIDTTHPMDTIDTEFGMISNPGIFIKPTSNTFSMEFLSTEFSLHEHVFYYWLRETTDHHWAYVDRPFTKATVRITFFESKTKKHMFSYVLSNVFPTTVATMKPSHTTTDHLTRPITFAFDNIYVISANKIVHDRLEKAFDKYIGDKIKRGLTTGINKNLPDIL